MIGYQRTDEHEALRATAAECAGEVGAQQKNVFVGRTVGTCDHVQTAIF